MASFKMIFKSIKLFISYSSIIFAAASSVINTVFLGAIVKYALIASPFDLPPATAKNKVF